MPSLPPRRAVLRRPLAALAVAALLGADVRAEDAELPEPARFDVSGFRGVPVPKSSRGLWLPTDPGMEESWYESYEGECPGESAVVQAFSEPWNPAFALPPEVVDDMVRRIVGAQAQEGWSSRTTGTSLEVRASPEVVGKAGAAFEFVRAAFAPRLSVTADLLATDAKSTLLAAGAADVLPRRWTPLVRRRDVTRFHVGYEVEVAQEAVAHVPLIADLPRGEEVHVRWTPGEGVSILEVFVTVQEDGPAFDVDLAGLRASPEVNAPGAVHLPRTEVGRARTALLLPAGQVTEAEVAWSGRRGGRRLRLRVGAPPAPPADLEAGAARWGVVRAGASFAPLEEAPRAGGVETAIRAFRAAGAGEIDLEPQAQAFVLASGSAPLLERLRATVRQAEADLRGGVVELRAVALPREAPPGADAGLVVGRVLPPPLLAALEGRPEESSVRFPYLADLEALVRVGASVTGLAGVDANLAQSAGGLVPTPGAWFDGFALGVTVHPGASGGARLAARGAIAWARPSGASATFTQRLPVPLSPITVPPTGSDLMPPRTFEVPLGTHGEALLDVEASLTAEDVSSGRAVLLAFLRGWPGGEGRGDAGQTVLLLARVVR